MPVTIPHTDEERAIGPWLLAIAVWLVGLAGRASGDVTPDSPVVQAMVARGANFLTSATPDQHLGARCLVGLVFAKLGQPDHPRLQAALQDARAYANKSVDEIRQESICMYHLGLAVTFLTEVDPVAHRKSIERLLATIVELQKPHGGWGYPGQPTGDTSMSQYAILSIWTAQRSQIGIPRDRIVRFAAWLARTQDPSGAWGYQGNDPGGEDFQRVPQTEIRPSLAAAGAGSMYVCLDLVGSGGTAPRTSNLPKVVIEVSRDAQQGRVAGASSRLRSQMQQAAHDGNLWFDQHPSIEAPIWQYYYLYALERYHSFRELVEGSADPQPEWYRQGVEFLRSKQDPQGAWIADAGADADTSFAILFLIRSARQSIERDRSFGDGRVLGGRGLPKDLRELQLRDGVVVGPQSVTPADELLRVLEQSTRDLAQIADRFDSVQLSDDPRQRSAQVAQLRRWIRTTQGTTQLLAIRALAADPQYDNIPYFLQALESSDRQIVLAARDALLRLRQTFETVGPPDDYSAQQHQQAIREWKAWYQSVDPNAHLLP